MLVLSLHLFHFISVYLSVIPSSILLYFDWENVKNIYGSDHFPILLKTQKQNESLSQAPRWKLDKANWEGFHSLRSPGQTCLVLISTLLWSILLILLSKNLYLRPVPPFNVVLPGGMTTATKLGRNKIMRGGSCMIFPQGKTSPILNISHHKDEGHASSLEGTAGRGSYRV